METQTLLLDDGVGLLIGGVPRTVLANELDVFFWGMAPFSRVCAFRVHARGPSRRRELPEPEGPNARTE